MGKIDSDPIQNTINDQIKRGIRFCIENDLYLPALAIIYSGIDTLAYLGMPANKVENDRHDFIEWVEKYIHLPGPKITGEELYSARCGVLHTTGISSRKTRDGSARMIAYQYGNLPDTSPNRAKSEVSDTMVIIAIETLARCFFEGTDRFLIDVVSDPDRVDAFEHRLHHDIFNRTPYKPDKSPEE